MKLYKHKAICEYCKEQEFDVTWIRKTFELKRFVKNRKAEDFEENDFTIFVINVLICGLFRMIVNLS